MQITITARHCEVSERLKAHAEQGINRLERYFDHIISADLRLTQEKSRYTAELNLHVLGTVLSSKEEDMDMQIVVDQVIEKVERQVKKYKEKLQDHRA